MKPFGVRLAAGAVTILFGAYAAALAQRDKQDSSDSWSAQSPSLGEPATPIADISEETWLSQPARDPGASTPTDVPGGFETPSAVQLVQHTEQVDNETRAVSAPAFDTSALPPSLADENTGDDGDADQESQPATATIGAPDWTLPAQGDSPHESSSPSLAMTLPADVPAAGTDLSTQPQAQMAPPVQTELPDLALGGSPPMDVFPAGQDDGAALAEEQAGLAKTGLQTSGNAAGINVQPDNILRDAEPGTNELRGQPYPANEPSQYASNPTSAGPSDYGTPSGFEQPQQEFNQPNPPDMAQNAPGFGQSAQQFDQPTAMPNSSGAGLGTPQFAAGAPQYGNPEPQYGNPTPQYGNPTPQYGSDVPGRMASLPRQGSYPPSGGFQQTQGFQPESFEQPNAAMAIDPAATVASPGDRRLEGAQSPSVLIQKRAPSEVKVGKPASFVIHVQNVGTVEALDVQVHDRIPAGMRLIDASPAPVQQGNLLLWQLGAMAAGDERTVTMKLIPEQEGELGSVARVSFEAAASVRTISTRPELKIVQRVPEHGVLIGQQVEIELEVSNPGTGEATGVVLQEDVPEGLEHPKGRQLDNAIGTLAAGEVRRQVLRMRAVAPGIIQNTIRLTGDDGLQHESTAEIQVIAPELQVGLEGPSRRFLERQATYQLNIANLGTADATNVEILVQLDRGFTFISTTNEGQYDPSQHVVHWSLAQLPAGGSGSVPLTLLPVEEGEQAITIDARADLGVIAKNERRMMVEGFAELSFAITSSGGPIELGSETSYEVRVTNSGSKPDSNVRVQLQLPQGLEVVSTDGDAMMDGRGLVAFQPKTQLSPGTELAYRVRVRGVAAGTHIVRAAVVSDQATVPVTKEESTLVYADQ